MSENQVLEPDMAVRTVDNQRLQVLTRSTPIPNTSGKVMQILFDETLKIITFCSKKY